MRLPKSALSSDPSKGHFLSSSPPCFLCDPASDLVYRRESSGVALAGLGPVTSGYSVVATVNHIRSAADAALGEAPDFLSFACEIRNVLIDRYGSCLLSEHGRVPVCDDVSGTTDPHCFHAHFLLFPGAPEVESSASGHFARVEIATSLGAALTLAQGHEEYFLLSPNSARFLVMTRPGRMIRQFVRMLVADSLGQPHLANWRAHANRDQAVAAARSLRASRQAR